jgi:hypothetical protein
MVFIKMMQYYHNSYFYHNHYLKLIKKIQIEPYDHPPKEFFLLIIQTNSAINRPRPVFSCGQIFNLIL